MVDKTNAGLTARLATEDELAFLQLIASKEGDSDGFTRLVVRQYSVEAAPVDALAVDRDEDVVNLKACVPCRAVPAYADKLGLWAC